MAQSQALKDVMTMAETLRDLVVSLSLQSDNFTRNIRSVNKQIQEAESYFKMAAAGIDNFEHTTTGLSTHLTTLQSSGAYARRPALCARLSQRHSVVNRRREIQVAWRESILQYPV